MENIAEKTFAELKEDISTYVELRLELLKLNTYERVIGFFCHFIFVPGVRFFLGRIIG